MYFRGSQPLASTAQSLRLGILPALGTCFFFSRPGPCVLLPLLPELVADQEDGGSGMPASGPLLHAVRVRTMSQKGRCGK